jgi:hypothetical protein
MNDAPKPSCQRFMSPEPHFLSSVDKFEPASGCGNIDHAEGAIGKLIVAGSDRAVDLEVAEHSLDAVAPLTEDRSCSIFTR